MLEFEQLPKTGEVDETVASFNPLEPFTRPFDAVREWGSGIVELHSGNVLANHNLVSFAGLRGPHQLQLVYDSERANPQEYLFEVEHSTESTHLENRYLVTNVEVEGINLNGEDIAVKSQGIDGDQYNLTEGDSIWKLQENNGLTDEYVAKAIVGLDVSDLKTGLYEATIDGGILAFNQNQFDLRDRETRSKSVVVVNESNSPFGSGWNLAGLQEIFVNEEESALLVDGDGTELVFANKNAQK